MLFRSLKTKNCEKQELRLDGQFLLVIAREGRGPGPDRQAPDLDEPHGGRVIERIPLGVGRQIVLVDRLAGLHPPDDGLPLEK